MPTANKPPVKLWIMNVAKFIIDNHCMPVSSVFIREPSTNEFKHDGLFSEDIFGQVNTPDRLVRMGYIDLRTKLIHPLIYRNIIKLKALYAEIMGRTTYARFDQDTCEFIRSTDDDEEADSGYEFFMSHFNQLKFTKNTSLTHNEMIDVFENNRANAIIQQCIVMPAGLRDLREDEAKPATDSINKLYSSLINYTLALPSSGTNSDIYDNIRFSMQKKINEIYDYIFDMSSGKRGFFQSRYAARSLALGTRNVVSTANMSAKTPDDPQYLKMDEMKIPLFQACKMFTPLLVYSLKIHFFNNIFNITTDQVALIDPKTNNLVYQALDEDEKSKFLTSEGINKIIDLFRDQDTRFLPVSVYSDEGNEYYLYMVYDDGELIYLSRSVTEIAVKVKEDLGYFDSSKVRPLTYAEMLYIAAYLVTIDKHAFVTRYPAIEVGSEIPNRVHIASTNPGRTVHFRSTKDDDILVELPEYPIIGRAFVDSLVPHPQLLAGMGMDFDGNCLLSSTYVEIRYTDSWLKTMQSADYTHGLVDASIISTIPANHINSYNYYNYIRLQMGQFPQPGVYQLDKKQAKVYTIPEGCEILSFSNGQPVWQPITRLTVEDDCEVVDMRAGGKELTPSTNESMAVFDHTTGGLTKVTPEDAVNHYVPVLKKDPQPYGSFGSYSDGWVIGSTTLFDNATEEPLLNKVLIIGSKDCLIGVLDGLLCNHKNSVSRDTIELDTISTSLKDNICLLCYKLGIRYSTTSSSQEKFNIALNSNDVKKYTDEMQYCGARKDTWLSLWRRKHSLNDNTRDIIPFTETERIELNELAKTYKNFLLYRATYSNEDMSYWRKGLLPYIDHITSPALKARILNEDVQWYKPRLLGNVRKETVYDFEVPVTKVFCVNNGVVVYDTASANGVLSKQANEENAKYLNSLSRYMHSNGSLMHRTTDLVKLTIYNLSRNPA